MPIVNRIADFAPDMTAWRRHLHQHPELRFDCHKTAAFVVERLREFGVDEVHEGIATSGVVALIHGQGDGPVIGLRADMDALPMQEHTGADHASLTDGAMHACGHDGHTTMLLGAARYLAETRRFKGTVALIFQPAEEDGGGAGVMVEEGILDRFAIDQVYALHTQPGAPEGQLATTPGPIMAAVDDFHIQITGKGGHGALPHEAVDPIPAALALGQGINTIVSRNVSSDDKLVVSLTILNTGSATNIVPDLVDMGGTIRSFNPQARAMVKARMQAICDGISGMYGVQVNLNILPSYPATLNSPDQTEFAVSVAREVVGDAQVDGQRTSEMGAEDFSYMLEHRPGCYLFIGQGPGPALHNSEFDFNDDVAPIGASFFARLVERAHPLEG